MNVGILEADRVAQWFMETFQFGRLRPIAHRSPRASGPSEIAPVVGIVQALEPPKRAFGKSERIGHSGEAIYLRRGAREIGRGVPVFRSAVARRAVVVD